MTINTTHVDYALYGIKDADHQLGEVLLKQLPDKIKTPIAVFTSQTQTGTSVVALLPFTVNGKQIVAPIAVDGFSRQNGIRIDSNSITSIFGKTNAVTKLLYDAMVDESNGKFSLLYMNKKEAVTLLQRAGLQLPSGLKHNDGFIHSIRESGSPVNMKFQDVTETQQFRRWFGDWMKHPNKASKIVNPDGTPMIMYHGSPAQFTIFDKKKAKGSGQYGRGFYFTDSQSHASTYGQQYSVYLNIRNPLEYGRGQVSRTQVHKFLEAVAENGDYSIENYGSYDVDSILLNVMGKSSIIDAFQLIQDVNVTAIGDMVEAAELFNQVNGTQYDGIVTATETVAFYPEQIKSATDNIGTFDGSNADIRHKRKTRPAVGNSIKAIGDTDITVTDVVKNGSGSLVVNINSKATGLNPRQKGRWPSLILDMIRKSLAGKSIIAEDGDIITVTRRGAQEVGFGTNSKNLRADAQTTGDYAKLEQKMITAEHAASIIALSKYKSWSQNTEDPKDMFKKDGLNYRTVDLLIDGIPHTATVVTALNGDPNQVKDYGEKFYDIESIEIQTNLPASYRTPTKGAALHKIKTADSSSDRLTLTQKQRIVNNQNAAFSAGDSVGKTALAAAMEEAKRKATLSGKKRGTTLSDREVLEVAALRMDASTLTEGEKTALDIFKNRLEELRKLQIERERLGSLWHEQQFGSGDRSEAPKTLNRMKVLDGQIERAVNSVLSVEDKQVLRDVLQKAREYVKEQSVDHYRGILERRKDRSTQAQLRQKLHSTVHELSQLLLYGDKNHHVPEGMKKAVAEALDVINSLDARKTAAQIAAIDGKIMDLLQQKQAITQQMTDENSEDLSKKLLSLEGEIQQLQNRKDSAGRLQDKLAALSAAYAEIGKGGESVFEGLMDAQDKLAFLAQVIFDFQEKTWTGEEAKAWSEDTHTITLPNGNELTLTTADAMSIYCLSRREQGLQHLLGGGTRVMGIQKGSKKAKDSHSLLTIKDIDAIISSLTDRQKQVAEGIQEFMSTVCSEWGNEISMKRFLTKEFTEKFYFPIESNDENLPTKDPAAQQSDLFRLLNISATKPLTPGANNEVIIRNIFDVFTGHAADMARLNSSVEVLRFL